MLKNLQKRKEGFTIIEVLIVLAIAGLIMLVVFLAVPALQRNSRNTQRKNDVSATLGAIQEYVSNNGGALPSDQTTMTTAIGNAKLGFYPAANVYYATAVPTNATTPATGGAGSAISLTSDNIVVVVGFKCASSPTAVPTADSARSLAALYAVETSGSRQLQCQSS